MMKCWDFDLDPFDAIVTDKANLGVALALASWSTKLKSNNPFNLRLEIWVLSVNEHVGNVEHLNE